MMKQNVAIVIGGGVCGAMAARVLSDLFNTVYVIEKNSVNDCLDLGTVRTGIPQGHHIHNVLFRGNQVIAELFPKIFSQTFDELLAPTIEMALTQRVLGPFGWNPIFTTGLKFRGYSRALLDREMLTQLRQINNIQIIDQALVQKLIYDSAQQKVLGVELMRASGRAETLKSDLVVDCSGRWSKIADWLNDLGLGQPQTHKIKQDECYTTQIFTHQNQPKDWKQLAVIRMPPIRNRGAYLLLLEQGKWIMTLVGPASEPAPRTEAEFREFVASLNCDELNEYMQNASSVNKITYFKNIVAHCHYFDRMPIWPSGLLVIGDAACSFNPVYGQGITTAAVGVLHLREMLKTFGAHGWERKFQSQLIDLLANPWMYSCRSHIREPLFKQDKFSIRSIVQNLVEKYRKRVIPLVFKALPLSTRVYWRLFHVQNLNKGYYSLLHPTFIFYCWCVVTWNKLLPPKPITQKTPSEKTLNHQRAA